MPTLIPAFALLDKPPSPEIVLTVALCVAVDEIWEVAAAIDVAVDVDVDPAVPYMTIVKRNPVFHPVPSIFDWVKVRRVGRPSHIGNIIDAWYNHAF